MRPEHFRHRLMMLADFVMEESWAKALLLVIVLACFMLTRARRRASREVRPKPLRSERRHDPTFLWQAMLILGPMVVLVAGGLWAIRRDYALANEEAMHRARGLADSLTEALPRNLANELLDFELKANLWDGGGVIGARVLGPGQPVLNEESRGRYEAEMRVWARTFPDLSPRQCFPLDAILDAGGQMVSPQGYPHLPRPPDWLGALSSEQREAWVVARGKEGTLASPGEVREAYAKFLELKPPPEAQSNALLARLRLELGRVDAAERPGQLLAFAARVDSVLSESGLPLGSLTLAHALDSANDAPVALGEETFNLLSMAVYERPSMLTGLLLARASALAGGRAPAVARAIADLTDRWEARERLRRLVHEVQRITDLAGNPVTNLWLDAMERRWLCFIHPWEQVTLTSTNGQPVRITNQVTQLRFYPQEALLTMAARSLRAVQPDWPDFLGLRFWLVEEPLAVLASEDRNHGSTQADRATSARTGLSLRSPRPLAEGRGILAQRAEEIPEAPGKRLGSSLEMLPSRAPFRFVIDLAAPEVLYATARQRAWLFGGLLVAAAAASGTGLLFAARAFHRQRELAEARSNLVSSVSHELRTPIASVRLLAESLERGRVVDPVKQSEYFRLIGRESRRLGALIENVLSFSRWEQGRARYEFEPTDVARLVRETIEVIAPYAMERDVHLATNIAPDPTSETTAPQGVLDGRLVQQALVNLLDNAIKHSPAGGTVTTRVTTTNMHSQAPQMVPGQEQDGWIELSVEDQGPGIPREEQERIFEPFYRLGSELRRETTGVGIGLTLVRATVEAHEGTITVDSEPGRGSRFTLRLPKAGPRAPSSQMG